MDMPSLKKNGETTQNKKSNEMYRQLFVIHNNELSEMMFPSFSICTALQKFLIYVLGSDLWIFASPNIVRVMEWYGSLSLWKLFRHPNTYTNLTVPKNCLNLHLLLRSNIVLSLTIDQIDMFVL